MDSTPPSSPLGAQPVPPVRKPIGVEVVSQKASPSQAGNHLAAILAARMERKQYWTPQNHKTCSIMFNRYETTSFQWFQSWRPPENRFQDSLSNTCARHSPPTTKTCHTKGYSTNRILLKISILLVVYIYIYPKNQWMHIDSAWTLSAYPQPSRMHRSSGNCARWITWSMSCKYLGLWFIGNPARLNQGQTMEYMWMLPRKKIGQSWQLELLNHGWL